MPIYEYQCDECQENFECLVFGDEKPECPACNSPNVCRQLSVCGFVSKDGGGKTVSASAGSSCSGCKATSCTSCGH